MSEEIKKILDDITIVAEDNDDLFRLDLTLNKKDTKLLLDYITNLQEENKKLKELCDKYEEEHKTTFEYWKHLIKEDYKTRIDKAIEYINKNAFDVVNSEHKSIINVEELLNILKEK